MSNKYSAKDILFLIDGVDFTPYIPSEDDVITFEFIEDRADVNQSLNGDAYATFNHTSLGSCKFKIYSHSAGASILDGFRLAESQVVVMAKNLAQTLILDTLTDAVIKSVGSRGYGKNANNQPIASIEIKGIYRKA